MGVKKELKQLLLTDLPDWLKLAGCSSSAYHLVVSCVGGTVIITTTGLPHRNIRVLPPLICWCLPKTRVSYCATYMLISWTGLPNFTLLVL